MVQVAWHTVSRALPAKAGGLKAYYSTVQGLFQEFAQGGGGGGGGKCLVPKSKGGRA